MCLFSVTIRTVEAQSYRIWRYQRFIIVSEFCGKPPLPPPFNCLYYLFIGIRYTYTKIISFCQQRQRGIFQIISFEIILFNF
jgi:hypothetical protein